MIKIKGQGRQGDILIFRRGQGAKNSPVVERKTCKEIHPDEKGRLVLAEGEVTGHYHAVPAQDATLWEIPGTLDMMLDVHQDTRLTHDEHGAIDLLADEYYVRRQTEYKFGQNVVVLD